MRKGNVFCVFLFAIFFKFLTASKAPWHYANQCSVQFPLEKDIIKCGLCCLVQKISCLKCLHRRCPMLLRFVRYLFHLLYLSYYFSNIKPTSRYKAQYMHYLRVNGTVFTVHKRMPIYVCPRLTWVTCQRIVNLKEPQVLETSEFPRIGYALVTAKRKVNTYIFYAIAEYQPNIIIQLNT